MTIGDLIYTDRGTDRDERTAPRHKLVTVNPDCEACSIAWDLGTICGCGDGFAGWFCSKPCRQQGEHISRDLRVCLHQPLERVL